MDTGNNMFVPGAPREAANMPYGMTFPGSATGRFSDGRLILDHLADMLSLPSPLLAAIARNSSHYESLPDGVNFAVAGSGALPSTAPFSSLGAQVEQLDDLITNGTLTEQDLQDSLVVISTGLNDYLEPATGLVPSSAGALAPFTPSASKVWQVVEAIALAVEKIRELGVRRFLLLGLPPAGCTPRARERAGATSADACDEALNTVVQQHNRQLKMLARRLWEEKDLQVVFADVFEFFQFVALDPLATSMSAGNAPCCSGITPTGGSSCGYLSDKQRTPLFSLCRDVEERVFWDNTHFTDAFNFKIATEVVQGRGGFTYPGSMVDVFFRGRGPNGLWTATQGWARAPVYALGLVVGCCCMVGLIIYMQLPKHQPSATRMFRLSS